MNLTLETTIGTVHYECSGHLVHVSTEQESANEFSINLLDSETGKLRIETSVDEVFLEVAKTLREQFPQFSVNALKVNYAPLELLIESTLIRAYAEAIRRA
jgi:hypothetical protein